MLTTARGKINRICRQTSCAIRRETESCAKANLGVVKTTLTDGKVATAAAVTMKGGGEQVNGRERETATLFGTSSVKPKLVRSGFAPRHLRRSMAFCKLMKVLYQTTFLVLLLFCINFSIVAQKEESFPTRQPSEFADTRPNYCWYNNLQLDQIKQHIPTDKTIIVIARLGDKDLKPNLNKRRLHNIRAYLTLGESYKHTEQSIILAEGEPTKGFGQVEFYLDGRLIEVLKARPNGDLAVTDCYAGIDGEPPCAEDWQKLFYPCKDYIEKRKQKQKVVPKKKKS